jgi:hypothetical protein
MDARLSNDSYSEVLAMVDLQVTVEHLMPWQGLWALLP